MSKLDTLGPFCWLLQKHLRSFGGPPTFTVYRGATLINEMIEEYKQAVGTEIMWFSFISTSKDRRVAEQFGNTLFIITLTGAIIFKQADISSVSHYPHEQEVLLAQSRRFTVDKVQYDSTNGKHLIFMTGHLF
ncbi:unnamed protein product [Rotaria sp. Silwood1]|nr:unnamed protein product [Rotaria sp. Silwood1]CAF4008740.1 unnamed protein product [Rotaria sp. Silwood1]